MLLKGVRCGWFKHENIEYRMNSPYGIQKAESERLQTGLSNYFIWSKVLFGEFF